jgi:hypothetical protein
LSNPWTTPRRIPPFHVDDSSYDFPAGALWARLSPYLAREQQAIFPVLQRSMEAQKREGSQDDRRTDQPPRADEEPTHSDDDPIREAKIGCTFSGTIEDQQLLPDEHGFGHNGTCAAGTGEADDRRQQMQQKDDEIAHAMILATLHNPKNGRGFGNSP